MCPYVLARPVARLRAWPSPSALRFALAAVWTSSSWKAFRYCALPVGDCGSRYSAGPSRRSASCGSFCCSSAKSDRYSHVPGLLGCSRTASVSAALRGVAVVRGRLDQRAHQQRVGRQRVARLRLVDLRDRLPVVRGRERQRLVLGVQRAERQPRGPGGQAARGRARSAAIPTRTGERSPCRSDAREHRPVRARARRAARGPRPSPPGPARAPRSPGRTTSSR